MSRLSTSAACACNTMYCTIRRANNLLSEVTLLSRVTSDNIQIINKREKYSNAYYIKNTINKQKGHARYLQARKLTQPVIGGIINL